MTKKLFLLPALMLVASALFVTSCKKDCSINQDDYVGQFLATENCTSGAASYNVTVARGASDTDLNITNVWNAFLNSVNATIDCETITIARQEPDSDGYFVEGSGFYEKTNGVETITISYTVTKEAGGSVISTDNCSQTVYTKL
ncbi:MAG: hypothetical protein R3A50_17695 [Saprospiraceae bacterium]